MIDSMSTDCSKFYIEIRYTNNRYFASIMMKWIKHSMVSYHNLSNNILQCHHGSTNLANLIEYSMWHLMPLLLNDLSNSIS